MKYEIVTVSKYFTRNKKTFFIKATQEYLPKHDMGHYRFFILLVPYESCTMEDGDIVRTSNSCYGAPKGKINKAWLNETFKDFYGDYQDYQKFLRKEQNEKA